MSLPGEAHGERSLVGYSPLGHKQSDPTEATNRDYTYRGGNHLCVDLPDPYGAPGTQEAVRGLPHVCVEKVSFDTGLT